MADSWRGLVVAVVDIVVTVNPKEDIDCVLDFLLDTNACFRLAVRGRCADSEMVTKRVMADTCENRVDQK